jgi:hypothetical protein
MSDAVEFVLSGELHNTSFQQVHGALLELGVPIRVHHDLELEWTEPDVDVQIYLDELSRPGVWYLLHGAVGSDRQAALDRARALSGSLERHDIVYRLELDVDAVDGEHMLTVCHPRFPQP